MSKREWAICVCSLGKRPGHSYALGDVGIQMLSKVIEQDDTTERVNLANRKHNKDEGVRLSYW